MSRLHRIRRRRAADSLATHDRARGLAAERLDGPLQPTHAAWLEDHLRGCLTCRSIATSYEADRMALRAMRDRTPEPPRDLWARTSAAIEHESALGRGRPRRATSRPRPALGDPVRHRGHRRGHRRERHVGWLAECTDDRPRPRIHRPGRIRQSYRRCPDPRRSRSGPVRWAGSAPRPMVGWPTT